MPSFHDITEHHRAPLDKHYAEGGQHLPRGATAEADVVYGTFHRFSIQGHNRYKSDPQPEYVVPQG